MPGGTSALTPEMLEALKQLSAEDFQARQEAVTKLQQALAKHFQQMVLVQELMLKIQANLAQQLQEMTLDPDIESQSRVASLMEFNSALSRWAIDVLALPEPRRDAFLKWGLSPEGLPLVVRAYARKDEVRATAAKDLAKLDGDAPMWLLEQLVNDPDREVSLRAMDAIWDKPATPQLVDILFTKATAAIINQYRQRPQRIRTINVHGRIIQIYDQDVLANQRMQDGDIAADLLIRMKSPLVNAHLADLFNEMTAAIKDPNDYRWRLLSPNYGGGGQTITRLVEAYKPKEAVCFLMKVLDTTYQDGSNASINNVSYRYSMRIDAAALLLHLTGQDPETYKIRKIANFGDRWVMQGQEKEEGEMVRALQQWWYEHYKEYGGEEPPKPAAPVTPAQPAVPVKPVPVPAPARVPAPPPAARFGPADGATALSAVHAGLERVAIEGAAAPATRPAAGPTTRP